MSRTLNAGSDFQRGLVTTGNTVVRRTAAIGHRLFREPTS
jgi:hypothetical protein